MAMKAVLSILLVAVPCTAIHLTKTANQENQWPGEGKKKNRVHTPSAQEIHDAAEQKKLENAIWTCAPFCEEMKYEPLPMSSEQWANKFGFEKPESMPKLKDPSAYGSKGKTYIDPKRPWEPIVLKPEEHPMEYTRGDYKNINWMNPFSVAKKLWGKGDPEKEEIDQMMEEAKIMARKDIPRGIKNAQRDVDDIQKAVHPGVNQVMGALADHLDPEHKSRTPLMDDKDESLGGILSKLNPFAPKPDPSQIDFTPDNLKEEYARRAEEAKEQARQDKIRAKQAEADMVQSINEKLYKEMGVGSLTTDPHVAAMIPTFTPPLTQFEKMNGVDPFVAHPTDEPSPYLYKPMTPTEMEATGADQWEPLTPDEVVEIYKPENIQIQTEFGRRRANKVMPVTKGPEDERSIWGSIWR